jgi:hypothetical protein
VDPQDGPAGAASEQPRRPLKQKLLPFCQSAAEASVSEVTQAVLTASRAPILMLCAIYIIIFTK